MCSMQTSAQVGDLHLAAAAQSWLSIREIVNDLLQSPCEQDPPNSQSRECRGQKATSVVAHGTKTVVMKAIKALGSKATQNEVRKFLRNNPSMYEDADATNLERAMRRPRLSEHCVPKGRNQRGEEVFVLPDDPCPKGVKRQKKGFTARMNITGVKSCCIGPLRTKAEAAQKDYEKLRKWRASMTGEALIIRVRAWGGARVTKWCAGKRQKMLSLC